MTMITIYGIITSVEFVFQETLLKKLFSLKNIVFPFSVILICLISCSNTQESKLVYNAESDTIKQSVKDKEQGITWTQELEEERLSQRINRDSMELGADVAYNQEVYKISKKNQNPVYPSLSDFGSLDTSNLRNSVKQKLNSFCEVFADSEKSGADSYFSRKYIFNYVFFVNDLKDGWKKHFDKAYPEKSNIFNKWTFGEPFNGADIIQIPVRFYADCGTIDVTVFLSSTGNNEFYQITIDRWQKYDGTRQADRN